MMNYKNLEEKTLSRKDIFKGRIIDVHVDEVELPNGNRSFREVVDHVDGVAVLALDADNNVIMVTQYRYVFGRTLLEIPAGKLDAGEEPAAGALRELREEVGVEPGDFRFLGSFIAAPGCYGEILHLYLARDLKDVGQQLDPDEFLNVSRIPFDEMVRRCMSGEIQDAKTIIAVLKAKDLLGL